MARLCVLGSSNMDLVVRAPHLPRPGETVLGGPFETFPGGKGANQALAARRLGAEVVLIAALGDDAFAHALRGELEQAGVRLAIATVPGPSGVASITIDAAGENTIVVAAGANAQLSPARVDARAEAIRSADLLIAQLEVPLASVQRAATIARAAGVPVLLNAAPARELERELLELVDVLVVNQGEARVVAGLGDGAGPAELAASLAGRGVPLVVVTLGAEGAVAQARDGPAVHQAGFAVEAIDTVAAGDAFVGALSVALAGGRSLPSALRRACAAGALTTTRRGAQPALPTRAELDSWLCS